MKKILLLFILLLCCSCSDYQEVNELAIVSAMAIDYVDDNFIVTYEIIDTNKEEDVSYTYTSSGINLAEAMDNITRLSPNKISLNHLEIVIISQNLANHGLNLISNYLMNNNQITTNFYLVMTCDNPKDILKYNNLNNSKRIKDILKENKIDIHKQFDYLISYLLDNSKSIAIPVINPKDDIIFDTYAIFKEDKLSLLLNEEEFILFKIIDNNYINQVININDVYININDSKVNIKLKDNKYIINLDIKANVLQNINYDEENISNLLKNKFNNLIYKCLSNDLDILGFKKIYYINYPNNKYINIKDYDLNINLKIKKIDYVR